MSYKQKLVSFRTQNSSNTHGIFTVSLYGSTTQFAATRLVEVGNRRFTHVWRRRRFRSFRSLCLFILRLRFFLTLSAHTSVAPPLASSSPIGSRHGRIWRPGWKERRASWRLGGGISPGVEHGRGGAGAAVGVCWILGPRPVSRGMTGSGGGSRRRRRSRRSGAAAAI
jgi:hypothetical protein